MILQALYDYYQRKNRDPDPARHLPAFGLEDKEVPFIVELSAEGKPLGIIDTRQGDGKKKTAQCYQVPRGVKTTSGIAANLLWGTVEYALGIGHRGKPERVREQHAAFRQRIADLPESVRKDAGLMALTAFYEDYGCDTLRSDPCWQEIEVGNPFISFRLYPDKELICQRPQLREAAMADVDESDATDTCLVTGKTAKPTRLHASIKGVWGAQSSGANIVSFNLDAFDSYNKSQGNNAPVGDAAAFAYTTALNHLLGKQSRQRLQVGDASTVFWAQEEDDDAESAFAAVFGEQDDPDARSGQIRGLLNAVNSGQFDGGRGENRFFVLGLAPNAARISVRFWHAAPLNEIARHISQWFRDLQVVHRVKEPEFPSLFRLLTACAVLHRADNIPPRLGGDIMRSILSGAPFPASWLNAAVLRCRAEQEVTYLRAAAIKACLNRLLRVKNQSITEKELLPMLDPDNTNPAYRLGRLFATLEKIQEEASPGLNATIRERYYGAASSTPVSVFTTLLRLKNHHLAKLTNRGRVVNFEQLLGEIMGGLADFPKHLTLTEQGRFALGYYHQRQHFFSKAPSSPSTETTNTDEGES